jgi:hypothetical protein
MTLYINFAVIKFWLLSNFNIKFDKADRIEYSKNECENSILFKK